LTHLVNKRKNIFPRLFTYLAILGTNAGKNKQKRDKRNKKAGAAINNRKLLLIERTLLQKSALD